MLKNQWQLFEKYIFVVYGLLRTLGCLKLAISNLFNHTLLFWSKCFAKYCTKHKSILMIKQFKKCNRSISPIPIVRKCWYAYFKKKPQSSSVNVYSKDTLYNDSAIQSREQKRKKFNEHTCGLIYKFNFGCNALVDWLNKFIYIV